MLFTIAIPVYNNRSTILETIESCIQQHSYDNKYEILIVDNHSNDGTETILQEIANSSEKIVLIRNKQTVSMYENHNICLTNAKGKYIIFAHSDDQLSPRALSLLEEKIRNRNYPEKYVVWGSSFFRDFYVNISKANIQLNTILAGERAYIPFFYGGLTPSGTCYSRDSFLKSGGFLLSQHRLSPSDSSTMLYLVSLGFEFEMMDRLLFIREDASTAKVGTLGSEYIDAFDDALEMLINVMGKEKFVEISTYAIYLKSLPILYCICLVRRKILKKELLKRILISPKNLIRCCINKEYKILLKMLLK